MGREQRRKEARKHVHKENEELEQPVITWVGALKVIMSVVIILLALYWVLAIFVTKEVDLSNKKNDDTQEENKVSNLILAANTFMQQEETYYVYYYDFNDEDEELANAIGNLADYTLYRVNTSDGLNKNYVSDTGNKSAKGIDELKVSNPTLIKVENDSIKEYYEGVNEIESYINK